MEQMWVSTHTCMARKEGVQSSHSLAAPRKQAAVAINILLLAAPRKQAAVARRRPSNTAAMDAGRELTSGTSIPPAFSKGGCYLRQARGIGKPRARSERMSAWHAWSRTGSTVEVGGQCGVTAVLRVPTAAGRAVASGLTSVLGRDSSPYLTGEQSWQQSAATAYTTPAPL